MIADFIIHTRARAHSLTHTHTHPRTTPWAESTLNPKLTADPGFRTKPWRHFASCTSVNHTASASDEQAVSACTTVKMVTVIESPEDFNSKVLKAEAGKLVVVDFFATWCGPCKVIGPKLEKMAKEEFPDVLFFKVDVDENEDLAQEQGISAMPTFLFFKNGVKIQGGDVMGANEAAIREAIKKHK